MVQGLGVSQPTSPIRDQHLAYSHFSKLLLPRSRKKKEIDSSVCVRERDFKKQYFFEGWYKRAQHSREEMRVYIELHNILITILLLLISKCTHLCIMFLFFLIS